MTALLSRDPSERGKTLKSLLRARRARLSRPAAVESCEVGSAPDKEVGARGVGVTEAVTCLTKLVPPKDGVVDVDALPDEGMCASQNDDAIGGWRPVDQGGIGDCRYRAVAQAGHWLLNNADMESQACQREAAWLRAQVVQYVLTGKHGAGECRVKRAIQAPESPPRTGTRAKAT